MTPNATGSAYGTRAAWIALLALSLGAAYLGFRIIRPFAAPMLTGYVLAVIFYPMHS
jgi:predicted PurR-regulated permease PerM